MNVDISKYIEEILENDNLINQDSFFKVHSELLNNYDFKERRRLLNAWLTDIGNVKLLKCSTRQISNVDFFRYKLIEASLVLSEDDPVIKTEMLLNWLLNSVDEVEDYQLNYESEFSSIDEVLKRFTVDKRLTKVINPMKRIIESYSVATFNGNDITSFDASPLYSAVAIKHSLNHSYSLPTELVSVNQNYEAPLNQWGACLCI